MSANERQVAGSHYKTGGEEHWDRVARLGLDYFQAQITKYVERWRKKNGIEDLRKAQHFLEKYIEVEERRRNDLAEQFASTGPALWRCRRCGTELAAETAGAAFDAHGECAGACYVRQD